MVQDSAVKALINLMQSGENFYRRAASHRRCEFNTARGRS